MISASLISLIILIGKKPAQAPSIWKPVSNIWRLIDVRFGGGVAGLAPNRLVRFDEKGEDQGSVQLPNETLPLLVTPDGVRVRFVKHATSDGKLFEDLIPDPYCQGDTEYQLSLGLIAFTRSGVFSVPAFNSKSGVAISEDQHNISILSQIEGPPKLECYEFVDGVWKPSPQSGELEIPGIGYPEVIPRFNDLRYISKEVVVFIGAIWNSDERFDWVAQLKRVWPNLGSTLSLESGPSGGTCFLFAANLRSHLVVPIREFTVRGIAERGTYLAGRLSVSFDRKWLYVLCAEGIDRMNISEFIGRVSKGASQPR